MRFAQRCRGVAGQIFVRTRQSAPSVTQRAFVFPSRLKRSSTSRSLALAGSAGLHHTWRYGFYQNDVGAGHVGFSRSVRPLLACFSHVGLKGRRLGAPRPFGERLSTPLSGSLPRPWARLRQHQLLERGHANPNHTGTGSRALGGLEGSPAGFLAGPERSGAGRHPTAGRAFFPAGTPVSFCCIVTIAAKIVTLIIHSPTTTTTTTTYRSTSTIPARRR